MTHTQATTLDALLRQRGEQTPERLLYRFLDTQAQQGQTLTLGQALARATRLAHALARHCLPGEAVLLVAGPGAEHPLGLFACFLAGCTAVPLYPPQGERAAAAREAILAVARVSRARVWLASPEVALPLQPVIEAQLGEQAPVWVSLEDTAEPLADAPALPGSRPEQPALLLFTSGSTGQPKGVPLTHAGLVANLRALAAGCGRGADDVVCSWLPQSHVAGLLLRLFPLVAGCLGVMLPTVAFLGQPLMWLRALSRYRASITAAPDFAYALCAQAVVHAPSEWQTERATWDLSALAMAISGGEMVRPATLQAFAQALSAQGFRAEAFHPYYGLTESLCSFIPQGQAPLRLCLSRQGMAAHRMTEAQPGDEDAMVLVGNGVAVGDTEIAVVRPGTGSPVAVGEIGEIWLRGQAVTPGYVGAALSPADWQGRLDAQSPQEPAYFRTGDLGFVAQGQVFITGRLKELLIVRGKNHYPLDIEASAMGVARAQGALAAAAFSVHDENGQEGLGLAVERTPGGDDAALQQAVRAAVAQRHGLAVARLFLLPPGSLPRTPTQKIVRLACPRLLSQPAWAQAEVVRAAAPLAAPRTADASFQGLSGLALHTALLGRLLPLLAACEGVALSSGDLHRPLAALGLSSLDIARLVTQVRRLTGVEPAMACFFDQTSLWQWAEQLAQQMAGEQAGAAVPAEAEERARLLATMPSTWPAARPVPAAPAVLLTGATGFLGAWLLAELLRQGAARVLCLVRATDDAQAMERLRKAVAQGPGALPEGAWARVEVVCGDLSRPHLGLEAGALDQLASRVDTVLHNAANVNFVAPYTALREVNVDPLAALWPVLAQGGQTRPLHFVSTLAVFNATQRQGAQQLLPQSPKPALTDLYSGYAQSKWMAESVLEAAARAGLPLVLHRPGLIVGDAQQGRSHLDDFVCRFLVGCAQWGRWPDARVALDLVPVDEVARGVAAAVLAPLARPAQALALHWSAAEPIGMPEVASLLSERGVALTVEPLAQWLQGVREDLPSGNALYPVHPFLLQSLGAQGQTVLEALDGLSVQIGQAPEQAALWGTEPRAQAGALVRRMLDWLQSQGHLSV